MFALKIFISSHCHSHLKVSCSPSFGYQFKCQKNIANIILKQKYLFWFFKNRFKRIDRIHPENGGRTVGQTYLDLSYSNCSRGYFMILTTKSTTINIYLLSITKKKENCSFLILIQIKPNNKL